jgi:hypothetical protein
VCWCSFRLPPRRCSCTWQSGRCSVMRLVGCVVAHGVCGVWCMVHDVQRTVYGIWCAVCMVYGVVVYRVY